MEKRRTIVAEDNGVILGVVVTIIRAADPESGHLHRLYVHPRVWGQRIGSSLYHADIRDLLDEGCTRATLWTLEKNTRVRQWYERHGWKLTGERVAVYPDGNVYDLVYATDLKNECSP
jgi:ribosomal protein S18 acetylase RimI-like enzyme